MAHHDSTPDSVLNAPDASRVVVHTNKGLGRAQRRAQGDRRRDSGNAPFVGKVRDELDRKQGRA